uniref:Recombinase A n=1 Tax=Arcella intermedia TaxID=1963864 RepID=A0A6B2L7Q7_9EUKA
MPGVLKQIEDKFGSGCLQTLDSQISTISEDEVIPTGSLGLDYALGIGGLPKRRIIEVYGPESSGKTTLALSIIAQSQKQGGTCAFIDVEHALNPQWAKTIGVNTNTLLFSQPNSAEEALEISNSLIASGQVSVVVIDSVAALVPMSELEGNMGDAQIGVQARLMAHALRKLTGVISKSNTLVIFINQIRMKIGVLFGSPETTSGGTALKYYASVRLDVRRSGFIKAGEEVIGSTIKVKVTKNKVAPPYKQAEFDVFFDKGLSKEGEILDIGTRDGIVKKSGHWYLFPSDDPEAPPIKLGQGRDKARLFLERETALAQKIEALIRDKWKNKPTEPAEEEEEGEDEDEMRTEEL